MLHHHHSVTLTYRKYIELTGVVMSTNMSLVFEEKLKKALFMTVDACRIIYVCRVVMKHLWRCYVAL